MKRGAMLLLLVGCGEPAALTDAIVTAKNRVDRCTAVAVGGVGLPSHIVGFELVSNAALFPLYADWWRRINDRVEYAATMKATIDANRADIRREVQAPISSCDFLRKG